MEETSNSKYILERYHTVSAITNLHRKQIKETENNAFTEAVFMDLGCNGSCF